MLSLRLHLRACTFIWLLCQTLTLAALAPTDCCAAHHVAASGLQDCHQDAAETDVCPMLASTGHDCPMHAASAAADSETPCAMRGLCNAPASALAMLIPVPGVLSVAPVVTRVDTTAALVVDVPPTVERALAHDTPPPRA